jgi:transposase-like protein
MHGVKLVISDDHAGLKSARQATMPGVPWQRCQFHTSQNAMAHVPKMAMRGAVADDIRRIYNADDRVEADRRLTARGCEPIIVSNDSTRRSDAVPVSPPYFPTRLHC